MAERKTVKVSSAKRLANHFLHESADSQAEERQGVLSFLEALLHEADAYHGFQYIGGYVEGMDETRRQYL